jgi:hypothetical protein
MTDDPPKAGFLGYRAYLKWVNEVGFGVFLYLLAGLSALTSITMFMLGSPRKTPGDGRRRP